MKSETDYPTQNTIPFQFKGRVFFDKVRNRINCFYTFIQVRAVELAAQESFKHARECDKNLI